MTLSGDAEGRSEEGAEPDQAESGEKGESSGESRRSFIKKLPYVAPVIETFLLEDTAYAAATKSKGRGRRRISPVPKERAPVPPPPPKKDG